MAVRLYTSAAFQHDLNHAQRFHTLPGTLFDLGSHDLFFGFEDTSLGGQIDRHFYRNDDWSIEQLFDELGAVDPASDRRLALLLEGIVAGNTAPDEDAQRQLVDAINPPLAGIGLELRETGNPDGYPTFHLVATGSRAGRPKQLIFSCSRKPDLRFIDVIDSDVEVVDPSGDVLVYDRPIGSAGLRWRDLQTWWSDTAGSRTITRPSGSCISGSAAACRTARGSSCCCSSCTTTSTVQPAGTSGSPARGVAPLGPQDREGPR